MRRRIVSMPPTSLMRHSASASSVSHILGRLRARDDLVGGGKQSRESGVNADSHDDQEEEDDDDDDDDDIVDQYLDGGVYDSDHANTSAMLSYDDSASPHPFTRALAQGVRHMSLEDDAAQVSGESDCEALNKLGRALGLSADAVKKMIRRTGFPLKVTLLPLSNNSLRKLPKDLMRFPGLEMLLLDNNRLTTVDYVHTLRNLRKLWIHGNKLTSLPPSLGSLQRLTTLHLHHNKLTTIPRELGQLPCLEVLSLDHNHLSLLPSGSLPRSVCKLTLNDNCLLELPDDFGDLTRLKAVSFHCNHLSTLPASFSRLTALQSLVLSHNRFAMVPLEVCLMSGLTELCLDHNMLSSLPRALADLHGLRVLNVSHNRLTQLNSIGSMEKLECLDASSNHLDSLPSSIGQMHKLHTLLLSDNKLVTLPPHIRILARASLRTLRISDNPLCEGTDDFAQTYEPPSLFALCAQRVWETHAQLSVADRVTANVLSYLNAPHRCFICARRYFESPAKLVSFVYISGTRVPLAYELCSMRCVETVQRGFVRTDNWAFAM